MTVGPVQLLMFGFEDPQFSGEIRAELDRLREADTVRLLDVVLIQKDAEGNVVLIEDSDLPAGDEGASVAALIGLVEAEAEAVVGDAVVAEATAEGGDDTWTVDDLLPANTVAAIALIEHRWATGLRDAIEQANGTLLNDAWIHRDDLEAIGALFSQA